MVFLDQSCLLDCSEDGVCPCSCDYSRDSACQCRDLEGALSIQVTKSAVSLLYPLLYARTVNYSPIEKAVYKQNCRDGALDDTPTCGWYLLDGQRVPDSQVRASSYLMKRRRHCAAAQARRRPVPSAPAVNRAGAAGLLLQL